MKVPACHLCKDKIEEGKQYAMKSIKYRQEITWYIDGRPVEEIPAHALHPDWITVPICDPCANIEIERWDERESGDEDSEVILSGPLINNYGGGYAVRVRDCHEDWWQLQDIVPDHLLNDALYARMCREVGLIPNTETD
tara:strand:- start:244 stop:660 length:417 start_codon:yes stop_codon:yes gene_type:complete